MFHGRRLTNAIRVIAVVGFAGLLHASTPSSGTIATPTDDSLGVKQTLTFTAGPFAAGSLAGTETRETVAVCTQAVVPPGVCDSYAVNLNLPADYWQTRRGTLSATVKWADAPDGNDMDLYIVDEQSRIVASSTTDNTGSASETATFTNPGTGPRTYRVIVVNWLSPTPIRPLGDRHRDLQPGAESHSTTADGTDASRIRAALLQFQAAERSR